VVRVNYNDDRPEIVDEEWLQSKKGRYYFDGIFQLSRHEIFVSPFDLNVERGRIEIPLKPTLRFGTPVFDVGGRKKGVVVLNFLGANLIDEARQTAESFSGQMMLLDSRGYWLMGPSDDVQWGFMFDHRKSRTFGNKFPDEWKRISGKASGQFQSSNGLFTFSTISPWTEWYATLYATLPDTALKGRDKAQGDYFWKIVSYVPSDVLLAEPNALLRRLAALGVVLVVLGAIASLLLSMAAERIRRDQEKLKYQATHDALTGIWNREEILTTLKHELARSNREGGTVGIVLVDVDHFKRVNDHLGHQAGDIALQEITRRIESALRSYDSVGRYGGEELLVVLPGCNSAEALEVAERIREAVAMGPIEMDGATKPVTISLGVVTNESDPTGDVDAMIRAADKAMYRAKRKGRNRVEPAPSQPTLQENARNFH
jgi:diguanylate cyclase (GGDEF)-like protein